MSSTAASSGTDVVFCFFHMQRPTVLKVIFSCGRVWRSGADLGRERTIGQAGRIHCPDVEATVFDLWPGPQGVAAAAGGAASGSGGPGA